MMRIATWNVCLGVKGKKEYIKTVINREEIDICCIQECDIKPDYPINALTFSNYNIEVEQNDTKARCCTYVKNSINHKRRLDLEGENNNVVIIEVGDSKKFLVINIYRSFSTQHGVTLMDKFTTQLDLIRKSSEKNPNYQLIVLGDFNLNYAKIHNSDYNYKTYFDKLNEVVQSLNLSQIVRDITWSRVVNGSIKESILDHIYIKDVTQVEGLAVTSPEVGDHKLIKFGIASTRHIPKTMMRRSWRSYSKDSLNEGLTACNFDLGINDVQQLWNNMENEIIKVIDNLAPYTEFTNNVVTSTHPSVKLKPKIIKKRRLLKIFKATKNPLVHSKIKALDAEILSEIKNSKRASVRRSLVPGNSKSLWNAVNHAKDINNNNIPSTMRLGGINIEESNRSNAFAEFFDEKVKKIVLSCKVDNNVYSGQQKMNCLNDNFMTLENVSIAMKSIKIKN